ncbi:MAG: methyltransferase domain-containing protein, partial [Acidobacteria bacterium]|nr:methyltransferase domain-containing protein [Acidobacteriota bacterium]
ATGAIVLDIGTGTGIVPRTLGARVRQLAGVIGCDRSAGMLSLSRATRPPLRVLAAEATALPFRHSIFDVRIAGTLVRRFVVLPHGRRQGPIRRK